MEGRRPGKQEGDLKVEDDEQQRDEVEPNVELHSRIVEGVKAALVGGKFLGIRRLVGDEEWRNEERA